MGNEYKRLAEDVLTNPFVEKTVPPATVISGWALATEVIPFVLGTIATIVGILATLAIWRERRLKSKLRELHIRRAEIINADIERRVKDGLPLQRYTDEVEE